MRLEICVDCIESALAAETGGADRIEICGSLAAGGTTPSFGLVQQCLERCQIPSVVMIRPHDGGFVYGEDDLNTMLNDIAAMKKLGVQGVVLGALTAEGNIDVWTMQRLIKAAGSMQVTFHRAFDMVRDPLRAIDEIIGLGVHRLLTSGKKTCAEEGVSLIQQLVMRADGRLSVMAGAGVNASNVRRIIEVTEVTEIHASASISRTSDVASQEVRFGDDSRVTSVNHVRELIQQISSASS